MERFETVCFTAEKLCSDHLADLTALHLDPEVSRYLGGVRAGGDAGVSADNIAHWDQHGFGLWVVRTLEGAFAGGAGLRHVVVCGKDEVEIAYTFRREAWGQGFATEITEALVRIGIVTLMLLSLVGVVVIGDTPSPHVLEKSGLTLEGDVDFQAERCALYRFKAKDVSPVLQTVL